MDQTSKKMTALKVRSTRLYSLAPLSRYLPQTTHQWFCLRVRGDGELG
nr:hypothetical protein [uncultured Aggregatibacter sp.]